jgi:hypothetical protein
MNFTYLAIWLLTMLTSWFAVIGGLITSGIGAVISLLIADMYIIDMYFNKKTVFAWGGLAFLLTDLVGWIFEKSATEFIFHIEGSLETLFADVFIFWHVIVGLVFTNSILMAKKIYNANG